MIDQTHRFKGHTSVLKVRSKPTRGKGFSMYAQKTHRPWRAAVVVSKKVDKSAVVRNRIRRRVYEAVRLYDKEHGLESVDIVFIIHETSIAMADFDKLQQSLNSSIARAVDQAEYSRSRSR